MKEFPPPSKAAEQTFPSLEASTPRAPNPPAPSGPTGEAEPSSHAADVFIQDQTSPFVGPDHFVSGEEVLEASLAFFSSEPREPDGLSPSQKTLELAQLNYLLGVSSMKPAPTSQNPNTDLQQSREDFASLYAAHAIEQAKLEKKKKKSLFKRISEFLKSIFTNQ